MCKPKNRVLCPDCGREKMLFKTEKKANLFIEYNWESLTDDKDKLRIYYCPACYGYHISSHKYKGDNRNTERLINNYNKDKRLDFGFFFLRDDCLLKNFKTRKEFLKYVKSADVKNLKTIQRVISYFDINHKFN